MAAKTSGEKVIEKLEFVAERLGNMVWHTKGAPERARLLEMTHRTREAIETIQSWMRAGATQPNKQEEG